MVETVSYNKQVGQDKACSWAVFRPFDIACEYSIESVEQNTLDDNGADARTTQEEEDAEDTENCRRPQRDTQQSASISRRDGQEHSLESIAAVDRHSDSLHDDF